LISSGIVIKVNKKCGIVLNDEGIYEKIVKRGNIGEGDKIIYTRDDIYIEKSGGHMAIGKGLISAAVIIFAIVIAFGFETFPTREVYAVVSIDINPSVQYYLDKNDLVLRTEAMNEDGLDIIEPEIKGMRIEEAINNTLKAAERTHYLKNNSKILVSAVLLKPGETDYTKKLAEKIFDDSMVVDNRIEVVVLEVDEADYEQSRIMKTSLGKYKVYELRSEDSVCSLEEIKDMKATEIIESEMIDLEEVLVYTNYIENDGVGKMEGNRENSLPDEEDTPESEDSNDAYIENIDNENMNRNIEASVMTKKEIEKTIKRKKDDSDSIESDDEECEIAMEYEILCKEEIEEKMKGNKNTTKKKVDSDSIETNNEGFKIAVENKGLRKEEALEEVNNGKAHLLEYEIAIEGCVDSSLSKEAESRVKEKKQSDEESKPKVKEKKQSDEESKPKVKEKKQSDEESKPKVKEKKRSSEESEPKIKEEKKNPQRI
jgi:hypothetical protein